MFPEPVFGPAIIVWQQHGSVLHVFHEYSSLNVKMSLPYLLLAPVDASHVGETEEYVVTATSFVSDAIYRKCD